MAEADSLRSIRNMSAAAWRFGCDAHIMLNSSGKGASAPELWKAVIRLNRAQSAQAGWVYPPRMARSLIGKGRDVPMKLMGDMYRGVVDAALGVEKVGELAQSHADPDIASIGERANALLTEHGDIIRRAKEFSERAAKFSEKKAFARGTEQACFDTNMALGSMAVTSVALGAHNMVTGHFRLPENLGILTTGLVVTAFFKIRADRALAGRVLEGRNGSRL